MQYNYLHLKYSLLTLLVLDSDGIHELLGSLLNTKAVTKKKNLHHFLFC